MIDAGYRGLIAWQKAIDLVETIYRQTAGFPPSEQFGPISKMRRAAVSIPSNIAEGHARGIGADFAKFLRVALGSTRELETQNIIAGRKDSLILSTDDCRLLSDRGFP
jgi:four helix bundle protein